jgi:hypothetical protein
MLAAPEAVPRLSLGGHDERGRLLPVEGAEALVDGAGSLEGDGFADELDDGDLRLDLGDDAGGGGYGAVLARSAARLSRGLSSLQPLF